MSTVSEISSDSSDKALRVPRMVTTSSVDINKLLLGLRERDDRIAFLERELVETRLRLASSKTLEDELFQKINKLSSERPMFSTMTSSPRATRLAIDEDVRHASRPKIDLVRPISVEPLPISPRDIDNTTTPAVESSTETVKETYVEGNMISAPLGKPILSQDPRLAQRYSRCKRSAEANCSWENLNRGSCASGLDVLNGHMNPSSCASGLDLLNGHMPSGASAMSLAELGSLSSVNRILGLSSNSSLKRHKSRGADVGAGQRRMDLSAGNQGNYSLQRNEGWGNGPSSDNAQENMFLNLLNTMASPTVDGNRNALSGGNATTNE
eukprot:CAMPEP_0183710574 /NCGR_PEP_ID=MMETSP0737-20130205/6276_1 /TAXON_ID=385413 /ORGANISM="Thalassiosira miniscula, Strain CCMP1093" /LENGTH=324 /DNA_ID=CAMNT_0025938879 /DNA_START=21 /DNA_END=995 /DNA_ORIENTATION=+